MAASFPSDKRYAQVAEAYEALLLANLVYEDRWLATVHLDAEIDSEGEGRLWIETECDGKPTALCFQTHAAPADAEATAIDNAQYLVFRLPDDIGMAVIPREPLARRVRGATRAGVVRRTVAGHEVAGVWLPLARALRCTGDRWIEESGALTNSPVRLMGAHVDPRNVPYAVRPPADEEHTHNSYDLMILRPHARALVAAQTPDQITMADVETAEVKRERTYARGRSEHLFAEVGKHARRQPGERRRTARTERERPVSASGAFGTRAQWYSYVIGGSVLRLRTAWLRQRVQEIRELAPNRRRGDGLGVGDDANVIGVLVSPVEIMTTQPLSAVALAAREPVLVRHPARRAKRDARNRYR